MSFDNIRTLSGYLDKHLVHPILEFAQSQGKDVTAALTDLLSKTSMFDVSLQLNASDANAVRALQREKGKFVNRVKTQLAAAAPVLAEFFTEDQDGTYSLKTDERELTQERKQGRLVLSELTSKGINNSHVEALFDLAFLVYDAGSYEQAAAMLLVYLSIDGKKSDERELPAMWGKLVCDTLTQNYVAALADIEVLRSRLEDRGTTQARASLLHYSLFAYFKRIGAAQVFLEHVIDFATYVYANTIQVAAPHLLRYLAAAAILNRKKRSFLKRVSKMAEQETYNYSDPFTRFLLALSECNFQAMNDALRQFPAAASEDYFLHDVKDELVNAGRMMIYEDYLKVHRVVSINAVASQLEMPLDSAEVWLVTLIQESKIDAEIDSVKQEIRVTPQLRTVHRDVISRLESIARPST